MSGKLPRIARLSFRTRSAVLRAGLLRNPNEIRYTRYECRPNPTALLAPLLLARRPDSRRETRGQAKQTEGLRKAKQRGPLSLVLENHILMRGSIHDYRRIEASRNKGLC